MAKKPLDPDIREFEAMLAEDRAAMAAEPGYLPSQMERARVSHRAILDVRPSDPAVMAVWLRWMVSDGGLDEDLRPGLEHVADRLEVMAGRAVA